MPPLTMRLFLLFACLIPCSVFATDSGESRPFHLAAEMMKRRAAGGATSQNKPPTATDPSRPCGTFLKHEIQDY